MDSQTYCPYLWSHLHLHVKVDGEVATCCTGEQVLGNIKTETLENIWNNEHMKTMRLQMLNNEKPENCRQCWKVEDKWGLPSPRTDAIQAWSSDHSVKLWGGKVDSSTNTDGSVTDMKLKYFDVRFNNLCNFKCRTCYPKDSSSIAAELVKFDKINNVKLQVMNSQANILYEEVKKQYNHVKRIYFAGGEPSMQKEHYLVLKDLIALDRASAIELQYSTNRSKLETTFGNLIELWKPFKQVNVLFSLDGYGSAAEYWRSGTDWKIIESNIKKLNGFSNIHLSIYSTISWPNIYNWLEFMKHCVETELIDVTNRTSLTPLEGPARFSLSALPDFKKLQIIKAVTKFKNYIFARLTLSNPNIKHERNTLLEGLDKIIAKLLETSPAIDKLEWYEKVTLVDKWRNEDFFSVFPEHEDMRSYVT